MDRKSLLSKIWYFIWEDNSIWSWLVNIILAFVLVKFIIYPVLGFMLGTGLPVVAVVSGSMEHDGSFDDWWSQQESNYIAYGITREEFRDFRFRNGFNEGDVMILIGANEIEIGDVIVFQGSTKEPIIHRVVSTDEVNGNKITYQTKGDHNERSRNDEIGITKDRVYGKAVLRILYVGWVKLIFIRILGLVIGG